MCDDDVLAAVRALAPALRERAAEAEALRRVPDASVGELEAAGFFRLLRPGAYGGLAADPAVFYAAVHEIAKACGSTGWAASVLGVHPWYVAQFDPRAQEEVWGADESTRICSSHAPTGKVTPVDGGFRLSGRWHFSAGCDHARWALLGGLVTDGEGRPVDMLTFLVPSADYRVDDVWDTVGLRGSGSNDILVEDAFVPAHRALGYGPVTVLRCPGHDVHPEPLYRLPYAAVFTTAISTAMVGIAEGAHEDQITAARERLRAEPGRGAAEDPFAQVRIARAAGEIDAARLQLARNMAELYAVARGGAEIPRELRARTRRDQALATERAITAVDLLMENAGRGPLRVGDDVLQRAWRDLHTGRGQAANDVERALVLYAQDALGMDVHDPML
ncbi:3-hydroxy-9,10-secoandrosta-1,3,5(10)-triene-9,17-dione monooxygenase oxygenase subunit [Streptomyces sp. TLI_105]|uniref:3-hydroxy-9,10-secoandrosta-1,3,5(10)-triene-9, 17-dione monooxygenase oxygenase subunit n=1 Tax=Streptomyces sp. TLI_105 TaxID=1881019 RepID=UPI00089A8637|nr:3-hydroxy-9,10-secoandrosta-1,3,5(10)-triene-9,17-dione monooxygenase oxygenase subunit [Streptomyces sp. TLI_105]SEB68196.1 3-hydroxy-9,10-secoandrosta-1,3,5(10)-triene-9,17-dione monooxygenase [Streptomyces sp. TLI_105]